MQRHVLIDRLGIFYEEYGSARPLILVHGLGGPLMWQRVAPLLSEQFHVVVVHLPGFGESDSPEEPYSTRQFADFLHHFIDALGLENPSLVGVSYGGQICLTFAALYPSTTRKLVLLAPTGLTQQHSIVSGRILWPVAEFLGRNVILTNRFLLCRLSSRSFHRIERRPADLCEKVYRQLRTPGSRSAWMKALRSTLTEQVDAGTQAPHPVLMMWGREDRTVPLPSLEGNSQPLRQASIIVLEDCGHSLTLEKPEEVSQAIGDFLV